MIVKKPIAGNYNPHFQRYIDLAPEGAPMAILQENMDGFLAFAGTLPAKTFDYRYAPEKWTVKEVLQHIIDAERVFQYRAFVGLRQDATVVLYSFDENAYAERSGSGPGPADLLLQEFATVRRSTIALFKSPSEEAIDFEVPTTSKYVCTARLMLFVTIGHALHHQKIISERYLP